MARKRKTTPPAKSGRLLELEAYLRTWSRRRPVTRDMIFENVPAYRVMLERGGKEESVRRTFMRDLSDLRDMGHDVVSVAKGESGYQLVEKNSSGQGGRASLDPPVVGKRLFALWSAIQGRRKVKFKYYAFSTEERLDRLVHPYVLMLKMGAWYLLGFAEERKALRCFRVQRIEGDVVQTKARYEILPDFDVQSWVEADPWNLPGSGPAVDVLCHFSDVRGRWAERNRLGTTHPTAREAEIRTFRVGNSSAGMGSFQRWVLSLSGDARIVDPPHLGDEVRNLARQVADLHQGVAP